MRLMALMAMVWSLLLLACPDAEVASDRQEAADPVPSLTDMIVSIAGEGSATTLLNVYEDPGGDKFMALFLRAGEEPPPTADDRRRDIDMSFLDDGSKPVWSGWLLAGARLDGEWFTFLHGVTTFRVEGAAAAREFALARWVHLGVLPPDLPAAARGLMWSHGPFKDTVAADGRTVPRLVSYALERRQRAERDGP